MLDGEVEGVFEDGLGVGWTLKRKEGFAFEDLSHHPVVLFLDANVEVFDGFFVTVLVDEGLGEGEAEELVVWVFGYEGLEAFGLHGGSVFLPTNGTNGHELFW